MTAPYTQAYQPDHPTPPKGSGLAISTLVIGIFSLLFCWVPILNNGIAVLALVGIGLGIPAWLGARNGNRTGGGMAVAGIVLSVLAIVGVLVSQAFYASVLDEVSKSVAEGTKDIDKAIGSDTDAVLAEDFDVQLGEFTVQKGDFGWVETTLVVTVTNKSDTNLSGSITVAADAADGSRIAEDYALVDALKPGQSTKVEIFQFIDEDKVEALEQATFEVVEASAG